ncbi:hypothetical protein KU6B_40450 [Mameliella alba]|uniref:DUF1353 domain-containing protein n=1 Tax=Mameliella TaxID=1434019 RepID=UPI000B52DEA3|nr:MULTISPECIES: DUF1353 domain-containing protein [Mameliella]MBV6635295.1 DUF1353 domain-containing protein [Mameliella sp.]MCR9274926.1 DUF1353 domain-containing protein [Paracoccaceae bacterium]OWV59263.1 hypothetical protein CDZ98_13255 [Mameliella alba]BBU57780.1 hypothetical protein KU6B_40450 [Mameliella alba]
MRKLALLSACVLAVAGCDPTTYIAQSSRAEAPEISCLTQPQGGCSFSQSPLRVLDEPVELPRRPYKFFPTADPLNFVDAHGKSWNAPPRTLTDGASIPKIFISIVGDPTSPEYINAAAVHDAYCGVGNERGPMFHRAKWEDVHVMFYDGLIVGGTPEIRAKIMFAAVWLGGPRWADPRGAVVSTQGQGAARGPSFHNPLDAVPTWEKQEAMRKAKRYIERNRPPLPRLIAYLRRLENDLVRNQMPAPEDEFQHYGDEGYYFDFILDDPATGYDYPEVTDPGLGTDGT